MNAATAGTMKAPRTAATKTAAPVPPTTADEVVTTSAKTAWASGVALPATQLRDLGQLGKARGRAEDLAVVALPGRSWTELTAADPVWKTLRTARSQPVVSVPIGTERTNAATTAAGLRDRDWRALGATAAGLQRDITVRLTLPTRTGAEDARAAFVRAATQIRAGAGIDARKIRLEWVAPLGVDPMAAAVTYPGDQYVDLIGVDATLTGAWASTLSGPGGLDAWTAWAADRGRRIAVHWTPTPKATAASVAQLRAWLTVEAKAKRIAYEATTATVRGGQTPQQATDAYLELW